MRGIGYSIINMLQIGNAKLSFDMLSKTYPSLLDHLRKDINSGITASDVDISPELFHEAYELLFNLINIKELYSLCLQARIDQTYLKQLLQFLSTPDAGLVFGDKLKTKTMALQEVLRTYGTKG